MIRRPPRSTQSRSSAASDVYKRQDYYRLEGALGTVGFISPVTCHFCPGCNRLRISAEGRMRTCLFDHDGVDIRGEIRGGADLSRLREIIEGELERKRREGHKLSLIHI